ncbi:hypothetical protein [Streptomyces sp. NPDC018045]|uniref:hypothetical protein n=1 Tax=Streptomyces sp. NPDC018045 TaxID=3365037 RepID=UPI00379CF3FB
MNYNRKIILTAVLLVALAGCGEEPPRTGNSSDRAEAPPMRSMGDRLVLPVEAYLLSDKQRQLIQQAKATITESCMKNLGLDYTPEPRVPATGLGLTDRRYGMTDATFARENGYHLPTIRGGGSAVPDKPLKGEEYLALYGRGDGEKDIRSAAIKINDKDVPRGGCAGSAERELAGGSDEVYGEGQIALEVSKKSFEESRSDPRVRSLIPQWSRCMKEKGYSYSDPLTSGEDVMGGEEPSEKEKDVAVADAECNNQTKLAKKWHSVESAIQEKFINLNKGPLERLRALKEKELVKSRAVISGN